MEILPDGFYSYKPPFSSRMFQPRLMTPEDNYFHDLTTFKILDVIQNNLRFQKKLQ